MATNSIGHSFKIKDDQKRWLMKTVNQTDPGPSSLAIVEFLALHLESKCKLWVSKNPADAGFCSGEQFLEHFWKGNRKTVKIWIWRRLRYLEEQGFLDVQRQRYTDGKRMANCYRISRRLLQFVNPFTHAVDSGSSSTALNRPEAGAKASVSPAVSLVVSPCSGFNPPSMVESLKATLKNGAPTIVPVS